MSAGQPGRASRVGARGGGSGSADAASPLPWLSTSALIAPTAGAGSAGPGLGGPGLSSGVGVGSQGPGDVPGDPGCPRGRGPRWLREDRARSHREAGRTPPPPPPPHAGRAEPSPHGGPGGSGVAVSPPGRSLTGAWRSGAAAVLPGERSGGSGRPAGSGGRPGRCYARNAGAGPARPAPHRPSPARRAGCRQGERRHGHRHRHRPRHGGRGAAAAGPG